MSALSCAAWAFNALVWGIALLADGVQFTPIVRATGWLLGGGFVILMAAAFRDWYYNSDT